MTDQELLELAAKAAGVKKTMWSDKYHIPPFPDGSIRVKPNGWNPLTDDDDALRLAVELGLDVCIDSRQENEPHTHVIGFRDDHTSETIDAIENHGDPYVATRRAIVRAAAEIGREMK